MYPLVKACEQPIRVRVTRVKLQRYKTCTKISVTLYVMAPTPSNWLESEDEIETHPMSAMSAPVAPEVPIPVVDDESLRRLLRACEGKGERI